MNSLDNKPISLRKRYISFTIMLGLFVITVVSFSYFNLITTKNKVNNGYLGITQEQKHIVEIRNTLLKVSKDINLFVLDPLNVALLTKIDIHTKTSLLNLNALIEKKHEFHIPLEDEVNQLITRFNELNRQVKRLVEYRLDINKQYPGLGLSANEMENQQDQVKSAFEILINEAESEPFDYSVISKLTKANLNWTKAISQTRIYMANRLASFSTEILTDQGKGYDDIHRIFTDQVDDLKRTYTDLDSFEGPDLLDSISEISEAWSINFLKIRAISESDAWRSDTQIMKSRILPILNSITQDINALEFILKNEKQNIDEELKKSDQAFNFLIFGIIALFLTYIAALLLSMEWLLFSPIQKVTQAIKSKAFNVDLPLLESSNTLEMDRLIDAFNHMDEQVSQRQSELEHQAMHDYLTGLPNRFMLNQRIEYQLHSSQRQQQPFTLFVMDLDYFKEINDTLGHAIGDQLLINASQRMLELIRNSDTLARLGGDEFAVLLPNTDKHHSHKMAEAIINQISHPFKIDNEKVTVSISIGIVSYPEDASDRDTLLQYADMAMYTAKRKRIGYSQYDADDNIYSKERLTLVHDLNDALERQLFELYYQPKINLHTNQLIGAEALIRWNHHLYGFISPEKIIEIAERVGIIQKLSLYVLEKAIIECAHWHSMGHEISVSVNLSVRDLTNSELCTQIKALLDQNNLGYQYLTIEITESVMMENLATSLEQLNKISALGIQVSIDDYGTGFSSLAYLKRLPVDELKIDKSFIMDIVEDENDKEIVRSTINLGHNLNLRVIAEGVETQEILDILESYGCDQTQGYFISRPIDSKSFRDNIAATKFGY